MNNLEWKEHRSTGISDESGLPIFEGDRIKVRWLAELGITELDCEADGTVVYKADNFTAAFFVKLDEEYKRYVFEDGHYACEMHALCQTSHDDDCTIHFKLIEKPL